MGRRPHRIEFHTVWRSTLDRDSLEAEAGRQMAQAGGKAGGQAGRQAAVGWQADRKHRIRKAGCQQYCQAVGSGLRQAGSRVRQLPGSRGCSPGREKSRAEGRPRRAVSRAGMQVGRHAGRRAQPEGEGWDGGIWGMAGRQGVGPGSYLGPEDIAAVQGTGRGLYVTAHLRVSPRDIRTDHEHLEGGQSGSRR